VKRRLRAAGTNSRNNGSDERRRRSSAETTLRARRERRRLPRSRIPGRSGRLGAPGARSEGRERDRDGRRPRGAAEVRVVLPAPVSVARSRVRGVNRHMLFQLIGEMAGLSPAPPAGTVPGTGCRPTDRRISTGIAGSSGRAFIEPLGKHWEQRVGSCHPCISRTRDHLAAGAPPRLMKADDRSCGWFTYPIQAVLKAGCIGLSVMAIRLYGMSGRCETSREAC
jgi:hypothetical protein